MTLAELKQAIMTEAVPHDLIIFVNQDSNFLVDQYIQAICDSNNLIKKEIQSLDEEQTALGLVLDYSDTLKVLRVEVFDTILDDYSNLTDTVIICNKIEKKIAEKVKDYTVTIPKILEWQVKDYMKVLAPAISKDDIDWLYAASAGDIYKITNELDKITLFPSIDQKSILEAIRFEPGSHLYVSNTFEIVDAILDNNKQALLDFLMHLKSTDIKFYGVLNNLLPKVKQILLVVYHNRKALTYIEAGCKSEKQFYAIQNKYRGVSQKRLQYLIHFLSELDLKLKSGLLDLSESEKLEYLVVNTIM